MKDFRDLKVWEKAHELPLDCYSATTDFPKHEIFGLVSQIRRAGSSIGANIVEDAAEVEMASFSAFFKWRWGQPAN